ncbi:MAG: ROK family protein [Pseudomonadota bacterium]
MTHAPQTPPEPRVGLDLGGTKISATAMWSDGTEVCRMRVPAPRDDYAATINALVALASEVVAKAGWRFLGSPGHAGERHAAEVVRGVGIGMPGSIAPATGRVQNANSTWLNGKPFARDVAAAFPVPVTLANDANCLALSELIDGAAQTARTAFAVILGTGVGGGLAVRGTVHSGPNNIAGEWGHCPLPWPDGARGEVPGPQCWCGKAGCLETWLSGPGVSADHHRTTGQRLPAEQIAALAEARDAAAVQTLERHCDRLARGLAMVINLFDPDVIVLAGGLSDLPGLVERAKTGVLPHIFATAPSITVTTAQWGDDSGVRGAAWLSCGNHARHLIGAQEP